MPIDGNPCFLVQWWSMATASTTAPTNRSTRSPMTYKPYTLNPSAVPYGLWIDIPFRKKGSTAIRSEAKGRGARFCPASKGTIKWWMPNNRLTADTVNWLNQYEMIRGERKAPVFNPNAMTLADINLAHPFRVFLAVPFVDKDVAKENLNSDAIDPSQTGKVGASKDSQKNTIRDHSSWIHCKKC